MFQRTNQASHENLQDAKVASAGDVPTQQEGVLADVALEGLKGEPARKARAVPFIAGTSVKTAINQLD